MGNHVSIGLCLFKRTSKFQLGIILYYPANMGIKISHYKDTCEQSSIMNYHKGFENCSHGLQLALQGFVGKLHSRKLLDTQNDGLVDFFQIGVWGTRRSSETGSFY